LAGKEEALRKGERAMELLPVAKHSVNGPHMIEYFALIAAWMGEKELACRLCGHAAPEQIVVCNAVAELCIGKGLRFEDLGEVVLKGFGYPVRAHAAAWR